MEKARQSDHGFIPKGVEWLPEVFDVEVVTKQMRTVEMYCSLFPKKRISLFNRKQKEVWIIDCAFTRKLPIHPSHTMQAIQQEDFLVHQSFEDENNVAYTFFGQGMRTGKSYLLIEPKRWVSMLAEQQGDQVRFYQDDVCVFDSAPSGETEASNPTKKELDTTQAELIASYVQQFTDSFRIQEDKEAELAQQMKRRDALYAGRIDGFLEDTAFTEYVKQEISRRYRAKVPFGHGNSLESVEKALYDKMKKKFLDQMSNETWGGRKNTDFVVYAIQKFTHGGWIAHLSREELNQVIQPWYPRSKLVSVVTAPLLWLEKWGRLAIQIRVKESDGKIVDYALVYNKTIEWYIDKQQ